MEEVVGATHSAVVWVVVVGATQALVVVVGATQAAVVVVGSGVQVVVAAKLGEEGSASV